MKQDIELIRQKMDAFAKVINEIKELREKADTLDAEIFTLKTGIVPGSTVCKRNGKRFHVVSLEHDRNRVYSSLKVRAQQYLITGELSSNVVSLYPSDVLLESEYEEYKRNCDQNKGKIRL